MASGLDLTTAATVIDALRSPDTRDAALDALEALPPPIADGVALAAAPALVDIVAATTEESDRAALDRAALLLARLLAEAVLDPASVYGAAFAGERFEAYIATALVTEAAQRGEMLTWAHALSYACLYAHHGPAIAHGYTVPSTGAGRTANDTMNIWIDADPMVSKKRMPSDDAPGQMLTLLAELLRSGELPELAIGGAWHAAYGCVLGRPGLGPLAIELGLFELAVEHLRAIGSPADALSVSRGKAGRTGTIITVPYGVMRGFAGKTARPDLELCVSSGLFDFCLDFITAFAAAGVAGVKDSNPGVVCMAMGVLTKCGSQAAAEAKIRGAARALTFCLEPDHDLDYLQDIGVTSSAMAARLCCSVFGRDEGGCEFTFTQQHIEGLTTTWSHGIRGIGWYAAQRPTSDTIYARELCVSDTNKPLLLANKEFIPYLVDALLLDPDHPRAGMKDELKAWCQQHHCEAIAQLAVFEPARQALLQDGSVVPALEAVAEGGMSEEARELAAAALAALSDRKLQMVVDGQKHVMLSYQWDVQAMVKRVNESLIARGYATWFDLTNMKGSTVDAMSDAIEGADVMLYSVSLKYKESANCRMEANYAHQQELEMIPMMVQKDYSPKGWLGLILGTRMWYPMWDADTDDNATFERRLDGVVREIGDRGKLMVAEAILSLEPTPAPAPAAAPMRTAAPAPAATAQPAAKSMLAAPVRAPPVGPVPAPAPIPAKSTSTLDARLALERESLMQQVQQLSSQLASIDASATLPSQSPGMPPPSTQLSESFYLERERAERQAERQAQAERAERAERAAERAERERAERADARLIVAFSVSVCTCGVGAAVVGAAIWLNRPR